MSPGVPQIPEDAPFSPEQRAWLNGFLAGLFGSDAAPAGLSVAEAEDFPWHDPSLALDERLALAEGQPLPRRLMAAMAQLDCGQCGYLCGSYAEALADGTEASQSRCVPGGTLTRTALKQLLADRPAPVVTARRAAPMGAPVRVLASRRLTGEGSAKDVRHVVIDLAGSGLDYAPGDSVGLACPNDPALVAAVLAALPATGAEPARCPDGAERDLRGALTEHFDIARPLDQTLALLAAHATEPLEAAALRRLAEGELGTAPEDADLLDLLEAFPSARPPLDALLEALPTLQPRLYSIASSPRATPGELHLCVATVRAARRGRVRNGVASAFLADRAVGSMIAAHIRTSDFRLPVHPATPVIMIGPGTGIAPFRAFLQECSVLGRRGRTWLLTGDRHRATEFLFGAELEAWLTEGVLTRLDLAFSRDQPEKIYVQDRMRQHAGEFWRWLEDGAHVLVCGDAQRMARDVDVALRGIAMTQGGRSEAEARAWLIALARQGRYLRDVY